MQKFFELLKIALGNKSRFDEVPTEEEWQTIQKTAVEQGLAGILYCGIEHLDKDQLPSKRTEIKWSILGMRVEDECRVQNSLIISIEKRFQEDGYRTTVIKGQGISTVYPQPLRRQCGDIDLWLDGERDQIVEYVRKIVTPKQIVYHHVDFDPIEDVEMELHFMPSWMYNPFKNKKLQRWFKVNKEEQFTHQVELPEGAGLIHSPTIYFNAVYILLHIYRHLFYEGIGLKQVLDYYFILQQESMQTQEMREKVIATLKEFGMIKFCHAIMWVLQEVFGMQDRYLIMEPNKKDGEFLLEEIMLAGDLGGYDPRMQIKENDGRLALFLRRERRSIRFMLDYPSEILWRPIFIIWHNFWRKRKGYL